MDAVYKIPAIAKELIDKGIMPVLPYTKPKGIRNDKELFYPKQYKYDQTNDYYICLENKILLYSTTNREGYRIYQSKKSLCKNFIFTAQYIYVFYIYNLHFKNPLFFKACLLM